MSSGQGPTNSGGLTDDKRKLQEKGQTQKSVEKLQKEKKPSEQNLSRQLSFPKTEKPEKVTAAKPTPLKRRSSDSSATSPCEPVDTETIRGAICKELQEVGLMNYNSNKNI